MLVLTSSEHLMIHYHEQVFFLSGSYNGNTYIYIYIYLCTYCGKSIKYKNPWRNQEIF